MSYKDWYRYVYFLASTLKPRSFAAWKSEGEPNPFWPRPKPRKRTTSQQEIMDIFEEHRIGWAHTKEKQKDEARFKRAA